jgi:pyruvate kinase
MSRERPFAPLVALTPSLERSRRMSLGWGMHCVVTEATPTSIEEMNQWACDAAHREGFAQRGERIVITAGLPFGAAGTTNLLRIARV